MTVQSIFTTQLPIAETASAAGWAIQHRYMDFKEWGRWDTITEKTGQARKRLEFDTEHEASAAFDAAVSEAEKMFAKHVAEANEEEARVAANPRSKRKPRKTLSPIQFRMVHLFSDKIVRHVEIRLPPQKKFVHRVPVVNIELTKPIAVRLDEGPIEQEYPMGHRFLSVQRIGGSYICYYIDDNGGGRKYFSIPQSVAKIITPDAEFEAARKGTENEEREYVSDDEEEDIDDIDDDGEND